MPTQASQRTSRSQQRNKSVTNSDYIQDEAFTKVTEQFKIMTDHDARSGDFGVLLFDAIKVSIQRAIEEIVPKLDEHSVDIATIKEENIITESRVTSLESMVQRLHKEVVELKEYSFSNNLVVDGIRELQPENTEARAKEFFRNILQIEDADSLIIDTCHRMGRSSNGHPRPIIVRFVKRSDKQKVLMQGRRLAGTQYHMWEHVPPETKEERRDLFRDRKERKDKGEKAVVRGSKLLVNGQVVRDIKKEKAKKIPKVERVNRRAAELMQLIKSAEQKCVEGSTFKGYYIPIDSPADIGPALMAAKAVGQTSTATHNVWAVSLGNYRDAEDDGEHTAGHRLLQTLERTGKQGMVVVARYYSGHDIGDKRFTAITDVGKMSIENY